MAKIPVSRIKNEERARLSREHKELQERLKREFYARQATKKVTK